MAHWDEFDYVVINDDLDTAVADLEAILANNGAALATSNDSLRRAIEGILG
jgi:guanylate kinase